MDPALRLAEAAQARISLANKWIIDVDRMLKDAADRGWPHVHVETLLDEPVEVKERVLSYFRDLGYQAYEGKYSAAGHQFNTIWFTSKPPVKKKPGVFARLVTRLIGSHGND